MPDDVKLPGLGKTNKKFVYGGAALIVGILGYAYWSRAKASTAVEPINPDAIPEDRVPFTDAQVSSGGGADQTAGAPLTVAAWVSQATDRLIELGRDSTLIASALGKYVTRQQLTTDEADIVRSAIGQFGQPPGESLPILLLPPNTPPATTPPPATGGKLATPTLHAARADTRGRYRLTWNTIPGAQYYTIKKELPAPPVTGPWPRTSWTSAPLRKNYTYQYRVQAHAAGKSPSNWSAPVRFKV
jgi:hypothetical protein